jgi:hypothetical protein
MTARILPQCLFLLAAATGIGLSGGTDVAVVMISGWSAGALLGALP